MVKLHELHIAPERYDSEITVGGWVKTARQSKAVGFIELADGSCFRTVQIVYDCANFSDELLKKINTGCALEVTGNVVLTPDMKQAFEIHASSMEVVGECDSDYPLQKKKHSLEFLRTIQHLRPRTNTFQAVFRVRSVIAQAIHRFFEERGFVYVHTPLITASDCEGAGEMFHVTTLDLNNIPKKPDGSIDYNKDFFGTQANLTVSGQLYGEAYALAFRDIYTFGPTFRAEYSFTPRHAAEFWMVEPEMAFCDLAGNMEIAEAMVKFIIKTVLERCPDEMQFFNNYIDKGLLERLTHVLTSDFARVDYTSAVEQLIACGEQFQYPVYWGCDLQTEHERYLTERIYERPVFVTNYPKEIKAFYMRQNDDGKTVAAMDLLVPGVGELIGGSQREERYDRLVEWMGKLGLQQEDYSWYLDLRRFGGVKHAGYGLGFERMVMYVTGISNIRDVLSFPRTAASLQM